MKFPPASAYRSKMRPPSSFDAPHPQSSPNVIVPRASSDTRSPLRPSSLYLMCSPPEVGIEQRGRLGRQVGATAHDLAGMTRGAGEVATEGTTAYHCHAAGQGFLGLFSVARSPLRVRGEPSR